MKQYILIVQDRYSLSNETDSNPMTDYNPGIWSIKTQKSALEFSRRLLAEGNEIKVTCYDNPRYYSLANKFIKTLGLKQELFPEPKEVEKKEITEDVPKNLSQLKKYLVPEKKIIIKRFSDGKTIERQTWVKRVQSNAVVVEKNGGDSWIEYGKADSWIFDNAGADYAPLNSDGNRLAYFRIEYIK